MTVKFSLTEGDDDELHFPRRNYILVIHLKTPIVKGRQTGGISIEGSAK